MAVLDLTSKQQAEIAESLIKYREIPVRYMYLGQGAEFWNYYYHDVMSVSDEHQGEPQLIKQSIDDIIKALPAPGINLVDLGCGNGEPAKRMIELLLQKGVKISYTPVDISEAMLSQAVEAIRSSFPNLDIHPEECDFEQEPLPILKSGDLVNLFMLLGNSLGNLSDPERLLKVCQAVMTKSDRLLIGNSFVKEPASKAPEYYANEAALKVILKPAKEIGLYQDHDTFNLTWDENHNQVQGWLTLGEDRRISLNNHDITFNAGEKILLMRSTRFTPHSFAAALKAAGLQEVFINIDHELEYALALSRSR